MAEQPERLRISHTSCCLSIKHPPGEIIMYGCESWTVKKAERQIIDAFGVGEGS